MVTNPLVFDIETSTIPDMADYADDVPRPPATYKDPEKIKAWLEAKVAKQATGAALDLDLCRIVCVAWTENGSTLHGAVAQDEGEEKALLTKFWAATLHRTLIGFNVLDFDLPVLVRRSQYLDVACPALDLGRYRHPGIIDLMQVLTFDSKVSARRLSFYARRFKLTLPHDPHTGADVPGLVAMGDWTGIKRHCAADVLTEWRLAVRLGVCEAPQTVDLTSQAF